MRRRGSEREAATEERGNMHGRARPRTASARLMSDEVGASVVIRDALVGKGTIPELASCTRRGRLQCEDDGEIDESEDLRR